MNERDYRMFEYGSLLLGWLMTVEWVIFCVMYDIPLKGTNAFAFISIGIVSMLISLIFWIKHKLFVQEMQEEIEKHRGDDKRNGA
jgi:hypothetical protein